MNNLTKTLLIVLCMVLFSWADAQKLVKGKVFSSEGEPLAGVSVLAHQSKVATVTQSDGVFELSVSNRLKVITLEFSFIGYKSKLETINLEDKQEYNLEVKLLETPIEIQEITVTSGLVKEHEKIPYPTATVMKKDLVSTGAINLSQALARTPGVYFSSLGNGVGKPVIRGLTNVNVIMLNNGAKLENFNFSSNHPFLVDEFTTSRVEIIKGPASLQYGSDAVGGVINAVRERPARPNTLEGDAISHYNTNTNGFMNSLGLKTGTNKFFVGVRGTIKSHGDYKDGGDTIINNTRFNERHFTATAGIRTNVGIFSVGYNYTDAQYALQNQNQINLFRNPNAQPLLSKDRRNQVWYQNLKNELFSSNNTLFIGKNTLDIDLGYQMNTRQGVGGGYNMAEQTIITPFFASMQLNTFTYNAKINLPFDDKNFVFGVNGANIRNDADDTKPNNPLLDSEINDAGIYAIGDFRFADNLTMVAGLRYDYRHMLSFPTKTATTDQFKIDNTYNVVNGSLGVTYNFSENHFIKSNFARSFRSPSMPELTQNGIHAARFEQGNPELKPQENYQMDFNYHLHTKWLTLDISPFFNMINNYIYLVLTNEPAPFGGGRIFRHVQNDANLYGGEVVLDIHPISWVGLHGSYSMVRADLRNAPQGVNHPTFTPQDRLTGEIKFELPKLGFLLRPYVAFEALHFFEQNLVGQNEAITPSYTLYNARIGTSVNVAKQTFDFFVNGNNLGNVAYIDHLSVTKQLNINMMGRNVMFGLRMPFTTRIKS